MSLGFRAMSNRVASLLAFALLCAASAPVLAQPAPAATSGAPATTARSASKTESTTVGEVVVQGRAPTTPQAFAKSVEKFVHDLGRPGPVGQISRWGQPVCPITAGLTPAFDDFVNRRIKQIAARVGAPGPGDCRKDANVMVIFTTQPDQLMADVRRHHEELLGFHYVGETRSLAAFQPPMKSWYVTMTGIKGEPGGRIDQAYAPHELSQGGSRIPPPFKSEFAFAFVVVDAKLLEGQAIGPVAERIAMLVLSKPASRDGCSPLPSVLDVLDPYCPSGGSTEGLTVYDEAYLKALYAYNGSEMRFFERPAIRKRIIEDTRPAAPVAADHAGAP